MYSRAFKGRFKGALKGVPAIYLSEAQLSGNKTPDQFQIRVTIFLFFFAKEVFHCLRPYLRDLYI